MLGRGRNQYIFTDPLCRNSTSVFLVLVFTPLTFVRVVSRKIFPLVCWTTSTNGLLNSETGSTKLRNFSQTTESGRPVPKALVS
jgi:hypothetical protein